MELNDALSYWMRREQNLKFTGTGNTRFKVIKKFIKVSFHLKEFSFFDLQTTLHELSFFINLRFPMSTGERSLSSACFLFGAYHIMRLLRPAIPESMEAHWKTREKELEKIHYQGSLSSLRTWKRKLKVYRIPEVDDEVLSHDECPRQNWKIELIEEQTIIGVDGVARSAWFCTRGVIDR